MKPIKKQIVTDESMNPVAVLIGDRDWQEIEKNLELERQQDLTTYKSKINLNIDSLEYQQQIRNGWS